MVPAWRTTSLNCRTAFSSLVHPPTSRSWLLQRYRIPTMHGPRSSQSVDQSTDAVTAQDNNPSQTSKPRVHWDQVPQSRFTELGIDKSLYAQAGGARFRQHVNPLKRELQVPAEPLDWNVSYEDPSLPLILDIGCGYGRFLLALANKMPGYNGLGLEIREPVVDVLGVAEDMRDQFEREAGDEFELAEDHYNDRAVFFEASEPEQPAETQNIEGGEEILSEAAPAWQSEWAKGGWLKENPLPVPTERELHVITQELPVYRVMLIRK